ncbi:histidine kinase [Myxococcota bacterium]|nr:histidine kinase [Myxococcota bacterium]MBU1380747.1 histidine kinase [Myxococcota bacterium]MBU1498025.1 histidine kinase [Myxococcota bacterium]
MDDNFSYLHSRKSFLVFSLLWLFLTLQISFGIWLLSGMGFHYSLLLVSVPMGIELFQLYSLKFVCKAYPLNSTSIQRLILVFFVSMFILQAIWNTSVQLWSRLLSYAMEEGIFTTVAYDYKTIFGGFGALYIFIAALFHYVVINMENVMDANRKIVQKNLELSRAELKTIRTTVHPHFLFNTLNVLSALIMKEPAVARELSMKLSNFLRYSLRYGQKDNVTLADEIKHIETYLEIEKVRFGARLNWEIDTEESLLSMTIPPLILLPVVENAVKHGIQQIIEGGTVDLKAFRDGDFIKIVVKNPFETPAAVTRGEGMGIRTLSELLKSVYGGDAAMEIFKKDNLFTVVIMLPIGNKTGI